MKNRIYAALMAITLTGGIYLLPESGIAAEDIFLTLKDKSDYGSGPSVMDKFSPGGLEGVGLFIGHPNNLTRKDRVLLKFDLKQLLLVADKIQSAKLVFSVDYFVGEEDFHQMEVGHFEGPVETLSGQELNRGDVETVTMFEIKKDDAINSDGAVRGIPPLEVDVTAAVLKDIGQGHLNAAFRLSVPEIETKATLKSHGLILSGTKEKLPVLQITLRD